MPLVTSVKKKFSTIDLAFSVILLAEDSRLASATGPIYSPKSSIIAWFLACVKCEFIQNLAPLGPLFWLASAASYYGSPIKNT